MFRILFVVCLALPCVSVKADVSVRDRAVDVFQLTDGTRLLGVIVSPPDADGFRILFRRTWLQKNAPEILTSSTAVSAERPNHAQIVRQAIENHVKQLASEPEPDIERINYLEERLFGMFPDDDSDGQPQLVILQFPNSLVRQKILKSQTARQLAGVAILNDVANAETATPHELQRALKEMDANTLVQQLPETKESNAEQTVNQILLHTDHSFGPTCRLININGQFISESNKQQNLQQLAAGMLTSQIQSQLNDLLAEPGRFANKPNRNQTLQSLPPAAVRLAESEKAVLVEVATMDLKPASGQSTVSIHTFHRASGTDSWKKVGVATGSANSSDVSPESRDRIARDERVQQISSLFGELGIGQQQLGQAISIGAVVEVAQQRAKDDLKKLFALPGVASASLKVEERQVRR